MSLIQLTNRLLTLDNGRLALDGPHDAVLRQLKELGAAKLATTAEARAAR
ncbi:hypothetical protein [Breoghania sp.]|nr:hypothetical protein [Breoghania sp.]MDJ0929805.1 hypothetical protein [Breoghania sp.]